MSSSGSSELPKYTTGEEVGRYIAIIFLLSMSALFAGLTLGMLSLDKIGLQVVMSGEDKVAAAKAAKIAPVREKGNILLCTLLFGNVAVNAYLSILMADLTNGIAGFLISTFLIVIIGEIIPQAACSRYALTVGARAVPIVKLFIYLFLPLTWPISKALDWALGEDIGTIHSADGLKELLAIHVKHGAIDVEQGHISTGAITYADKLVKQIMTPYNTAFKLSATATLNHKLITDIFKSGYSRIPVYETDVNDVIGLLFVKDLIFVDPDDETPVKNFIQVFGRQFHLVWPDEKLGDVLRIFKQGKSHMAIVRDVNNSGEGDPYFEMLGVVTLEDIIEEILQSEIKDEGDVDDEGGVDAFDYGKLRLLDKGKLASDKLTKSEALAVGAHLQRNIAPFKTVFYDSGIPDEPSRPSVVYADSVEGDVHTPILGDRHVEMTKLASKRKPIGFLEHLLDSCPIIDQVRKSPIGNSIPDPVDFLFTKDKPTDSMVIVITGKITVMSGSDDFQSEAGPWSVLGARALGVRATDGEMTRRVHSASPGEADFAVDAEAGVEQLYVPDFSAFIATPALRFIRISRADYLRALHGKYAFGSLAEVGREQDAASGSSKRAAKTLKGQAFNAGSGQGQLQLSLGRDRVAFTIRAPKDSNTSSVAPSASADAAPTPNVSFPAPPSHPNAQRTHSNPKQQAPPSTSTSASASI